MSSVFAGKRNTDLLLVFLLAVLVLVSLFLEKWRILDQQTRLLNLHVAEVNKQLDRLLFFPKVIASDPRFIAVLRDKTENSLFRANELLEEMTHTSEAAFIFIMDPQGNTIASGNWRQPESFIGKNYGFRPYFQEAITGKQATYYAVGATTGLPGFFIANPILDGDKTLGVIVVKIHLESLQDSWGRLDYDIALFDELGVAILSNRDDFLYVPLNQIPVLTLQRIEREKRYSLSRSASFTSRSPNEVIFHKGDKSGYLTVARQTGPEPWQVRLFYPASSYWKTIALYASVLAGFVLLIYLLLRLFQQQKFIAQVERNHALELEAKITERTGQLRSAQQQLIIQANYAMLGKMSAAINHEINQPLTSLRFNLASLRQLLENQPVHLDEVSQIAVESDLTTKRISRVMETLRSISKTANTDFETLDLDELIQDTVSIVRRERPNISRCLHTVASTPDICVRGNFILLQQAILNLLANGFDAILACDNPRIILGSNKSGNMATIEVTDKWGWR